MHCAKHAPPCTAPEPRLGLGKAGRMSDPAFTERDYTLLQPRASTLPPPWTLQSTDSLWSSTGSFTKEKLRRASQVMLEHASVAAKGAVDTAKKPISWFFVACVVGAFVFGFVSGGASALALPHPGSDFVCHNGESDVNLDTACARIREFEGSAGARRRRTTSVPTAYSCLPHYRIPVTGTDGRVTFPYHATSDMMEPEIGKHTLAIIVIHGALRDADTYFCMMRSVKFAQKDRDPYRILVITPDFNYADDPGVQPGDAWWNHSKPWGDWRAGAHSAPESGRGQTVSSFQVLDTFISLLSDRTRFPNLDKITLVGHSAGGQSVQRYAFATLVPPQARPTIRYVVANPSSYAYLDARRPKYRCGDCDCNDNECDCRPTQLAGEAAAAHVGHDDAGGACPEAEVEDNGAALAFMPPPQHGFSREQPSGFVCGDRNFNAWPYGLEQLGLYAQLRPLNASLALFPRRDVVYLVGQNDTCNDGLPVCNPDCWQRDNDCFRNEMDTRCPAMLEGPWRKLRGHLYMRYLRAFYGRPVHDLHEVSGVGHNATAMFYAPVALTHIFRIPNVSVAETDPS